VIARIMAEGMRATLGQPVVVENVTGAGGTIGVGRVARAMALSSSECLGECSSLHRAG
jgi:tripartite-type tricarboxylate transporter receptor subunit TctC